MAVAQGVVSLPSEPAVGATLDASAGTIDVDGYAASQVTTLAPHVWTSANIGGPTQLRSDVDGMLSRFASGHLTGYAMAAAALDFDSATWIRPTVALDGGTGAYRGQGSGAYLNAELRLGRADAIAAGPVVLGWWTATGTGVARAEGQYATRHAAVGASAQWRLVSGALSANVVRASDVTYTDAIAHLGVHPHAGVQAECTAGLRAGANGAGRRRWADVSGLVPLPWQSAIVVSAGAVPVDPEHGALGARYATVALRLNFGGVSTHEMPTLESSSATPRTLVSALAPDGARIVTVLIPTARTVEIMGDFTEWQATPMTPTQNGVWAARVVLAPGSHRVNVRVDGGAWRPPPGLPEVPDDFGGLVGLLVIR